MAHAPAPALVLREGDEEELRRWVRSSAVRAGLAQRARIVLLASEGMANTEIAERVGVARQSVLSWRSRYAQCGLAGLGDRGRSGRPREADSRKVLSATLTPPARSTGLTHWSSRELAKKLKIGNATVARIWREHGIQPWRSEGFRFSTDPELEAKVIDVVGLYLDPPRNAVVLCVDEKSQIQALDRTAPVLPMAPHLIERRSPDYVRNGTTTLFAALSTATAKITARCQPRHRRQEFLVFCRQVARAYPDVELHLVMDNYATHKHPAVRDWLADNPRIHAHFTPTHASWMNMVEILFGIAERQAIRRGTFRSVRELTTTIRRFIDHYNADCEPFTWTKPADQILKKAKRPTTSETDH